MFSVLVEVKLRPGIADPQGATIERSLPTLGYTGVTGVTVGKAIRFTIEGDDELDAQRQVEDLCHRFLTNPVIEDAVISVEVVTSAVKVTASSAANEQPGCCGRYTANMWPALAGASVGSTHAVPYFAAKAV